MCGQPGSSSHGSCPSEGERRECVQQPPSMQQGLSAQSAASLDRAFRALADRRRRAIIRALTRTEPCTVSEVARHSGCPRAAVAEHMRVLERAGLVERTTDGPRRQFRLQHKALREAGEWLARWERLWVRELDRLDRRLAQAASWEHP
jgi:DNA-binding transcriptional ArsR family regulator